VPLVIISGSHESPDTIAAHRQLAQLSSRGRHMIATNSGHWIHLDEPGIVVTTIREIVERARRPTAA
jgi:pimeloyl-ACP methyl ester carboxylesterase